MGCLLPFLFVTFPSNRHEDAGAFVEVDVGSDLPCCSNLELLSLARTPGTSNGSTEAINGRLERLRGSALGFRNLIRTTSRGVCSKPADSVANYTLDRDELQRS